MKTVLVTGATGFVGRFLCTRLLADGWSVHGTLLDSEITSDLVDKVTPVAIEPLGAETIWRHALVGVDTIIHLAARVHVMHETASDPLAEFRKTNVLGTVNLSNQAVLAGVKRFIFMSTIGVNGDNSITGPYTESDTPTPHNPYSVSKYEAESVLQKVSSETGMEVVIIRAPIIYGPGNPGNFRSLLKIVSMGIPLPLESVVNKRSLIYVGNLVDVLATCTEHPAAAGQTFLVSDGEDVSTPELIRRTASALGVTARLFPVPPALIRLAGTLTGRSAAVRRLTGSLEVDSSKIKNALGWRPPYTMDQGLMETAQWFMKQS